MQWNTIKKKKRTDDWYMYHSSVSSILLREENQPQKNTYYMTPFIQSSKIGKLIKHSQTRETSFLLQWSTSGVVRPDRVLS